jgi:hypothetical protein
MPGHANHVSPLAAALRDSEPLARLAERLHESRRRLDCIASALPPELAAQVQSGPIDADGWTLLAASPAVAAKLRQLVPRLQAKLTDGRFTELPMRVKVLPA